MREPVVIFTPGGSVYNAFMHPDSVSGENRSKYQTRESERDKSRIIALDRMPAALAALMSSGWLAVSRKQSVHPEAARFAARRELLSKAFPGEYLIITAGGGKQRADDANYRFRLASNFMYFVGGGQPGNVLVLEPSGRSHRSTLFSQEFTQGIPEFFDDGPNGEAMLGANSSLDETQSYYAVDRCEPLAQLDHFCSQLQAANSRVRLIGVNEGPLERFDLDDELHLFVSEMRLVKDDYELSELRKAAKFTKLAFEDAIREMKRSKTERAVEVAFWGRARVEGNGVGYQTIAAAGWHACTRHWTRNDGMLRNGQLLVLDGGVECLSLYTADITRTLPISGRFSAEQKLLYDLVYKAHQAAINAIKPGRDFLDPNRQAMFVLTQGLIDLGVLRCSVEEAMDPSRLYHKRYTRHNVSHMLGLDVHDCAAARPERYREGVMAEGMVLTVEPGLYFQPNDATVPEQFRGIGIRIEDDIAVIQTGYENLSSGIPAQSADVERWILDLQSTETIL